MQFWFTNIISDDLIIINLFNLIMNWVLLLVTTFVLQIL